MIPVFSLPLLPRLAAQAEAVDLAVTGRWALITLAIVGVVLVLVLIALLVTLLQVKRLAARITEGVQRLEPAVHPVLERARGVGENVERITHSVRKDVEDLSASVETLHARVQQASGRVEERIEEFNALMSLVQSEAEGMLLDTAATVHGVRAGARTLAAQSDDTFDEDDSDVAPPPPALEPEAP